MDKRTEWPGGYRAGNRVWNKDLNTWGTVMAEGDTHDRDEALFWKPERHPDHVPFRADNARYGFLCWWTHPLCLSRHDPNGKEERTVQLTFDFNGGAK